MTGYTNITIRRLLSESGGDVVLQRALKAVHGADASDYVAWQRLIREAERRQKVVIVHTAANHPSLRKIQVKDVTWQDLPREKHRDYLLVAKDIAGGYQQVYIDELAQRILAKKARVEVAGDLSGVPQHMPPY